MSGHFGAMVSCGKSSEQMGSRYVKSEMVSADTRATIFVSPSEHAGLAGTTLVVPRGSLSRNTRITLEPGANSPVQIAYNEFDSDATAGGSRN